MGVWVLGCVNVSVMASVSAFACLCVCDGTTGWEFSTCPLWTSCVPIVPSGGTSPAVSGVRTQLRRNWSRHQKCINVRSKSLMPHRVYAFTLWHTTQCVCCVPFILLLLKQKCCPVVQINWQANLTTPATYIHLQTYNFHTEGWQNNRFERWIPSGGFLTEKRNTIEYVSGSTGSHNTYTYTETKVRQDCVSGCCELLKHCPKTQELCGVPPFYRLVSLRLRISKPMACGYHGWQDLGAASNSHSGQVDDSVVKMCKTQRAHFSILHVFQTHCCWCSSKAVGSSTLLYSSHEMPQVLPQLRFAHFSNQSDTF